MAVTDISPNIDNYFSGKGIVKIKRLDLAETLFRDVGDCPIFELTPNVAKMEHYSSRGPTRFRDRTDISQKTLAVRIQFDELTAENFAIALMAHATSGSSGSHYAYQMDIMSAAEVQAAVRLVGTNAIGAPVQIDLANVTFSPSAAVNMIMEQYGSLEIQGDVNAGSDGSFGKMYWDITQEINPDV